MEEHNIYCDESCHLENDGIPIMLLGAVQCPKLAVRTVSEKIRKIKQDFGLSRSFEIKWTKISRGKVDFYKALVNYFFDSEYLNFRCVVINNKDQLSHEAFNQDHDSWYYKMYFYLLKQLLFPMKRYNVYLDIKDSSSNEKVIKLKEILGNARLDFDRTMINKIQQIRSHESEILQLADLLMGAIGYCCRGLKTNAGKLDVVDLIKQRSNYVLEMSTLPMERKFNLFHWKPRGI